MAKKNPAAEEGKTPKVEEPKTPASGQDETGGANAQDEHAGEGANATSPTAAEATAEPPASDEKPEVYTPQIIRVIGFRGQYYGVTFNQDGVSTEPVPADVCAKLKADFPHAEIVTAEDIELSIVADGRSVGPAELPEKCIRVTDDKGNPFIGAYLDARFNEQGVSDGEVSEATLKALTEQFPKLVLRLE